MFWGCVLSGFLEFLVPPIGVLDAQILGVTPRETKKGIGQLFR